ncbi:hypothetical protein Bca4012_071931 [Brassica carinata]
MEGVVLNAMVRSIRWPRTVIYQVVKNLFDVPTAAAVIDGSFLSTAEAILWESLGFSSMIDLGMYTVDSLWRYGSRMSTALELEFCSASQTTHHVALRKLPLYPALNTENPFLSSPSTEPSGLSENAETYSYSSLDTLDYEFLPIKF